MIGCKVNDGYEAYVGQISRIIVSKEWVEKNNLKRKTHIYWQEWHNMDKRRIWEMERKRSDWKVEV